MTSKQKISKDLHIYYKKYRVLKGRDDVLADYYYYHFKQLTYLYKEYYL